MSAATESCPTSSKRRTMRIIVVWEEIPEATRIYSLIVGAETAEKIKAAHGSFINSGDTIDEKAAEWLNEYLAGQIPSIDTRKEHSRIIEVSEPSTIVLSGFIL